MRGYKDEVYLFSLAKHTPGKIIACRTPSGNKQTGRNIFSCLKMGGDELDFFNNACSDFGSTPVATLCKGEKRETVIFFKDLAFGTSLCLAVVTRFNAEDVAAVLENGELGDMLISDGIKNAKREDLSFDRHREIYIRLFEIISGVGHIGALKTDYGPARVDAIIKCAFASAALAEVEVDTDVWSCEENEGADHPKDIFDGRICAAAILMSAIVARYHSKDKKYRLEIAAGIKNLSVKISFRAKDDGWEAAFEHLKRIAEDSCGIPFSYECRKGRVSVDLVPFYADVSFVGVKEGDHFTSLVDLIGDR